MEMLRGHLPAQPLLPSLLVPGTPGASLSSLLRAAYDQALGSGSLSPGDRLALLSAALERPDSRGSLLHSVGATLLVQNQDERPMNLGETWQDLAHTTSGRLLLQTTLNLGQQRPVANADLMRTYDHLNHRAETWQQIMVLGSMLDMAGRLQRPFLTPDPDDRMLPWLRQLVDARTTLEEILRGA